MQTTTTADVIIAGAGCAGLSLAVHLVQSGVTDRRILLVDGRTEYKRDRTWCFWNSDGPTPFDEAVTHSWKQWRVAAPDSPEALQRSDRFLYQHIPADRFYETALGILRDFNNVEVRLGCPVHGLHDEGAMVRVSAGDGEILAPVVFDSRPQRRQSPVAPALFRPRHGALLQHFVGVQVRADQDIFDPATVTLMDFRVSQDGGIHFIYILPFSRRDALLEATFISPRPLAREIYLSSLKRYCAERFPQTSFCVQGEEEGVIRMGGASPGSSQRSPRILLAGGAGGMVKPSTGYAFLAIQRWSKQIAAQMAQGQEVPAPPRPRSHRADFMDRIFLSFLQDHPAEVPALFARLFRNTPPDCLVRFLTDGGLVGDDLAVMRALPKTAFLKQASDELWGTVVSPLRVRTA